MIMRIGRIVNLTTEVSIKVRRDLEHHLLQGHQMLKDKGVHQRILLDQEQ